MRSSRKGGVPALERSRNGLFAFLGRTPHVVGAASGAARKETANQARRKATGQFRM